MINNYKSEFEQILDISNGPVEYELFVALPNIKMKHQSYPMSIQQTEFNYIRDIIVRYNLKRGLEIATAFGVSAVAQGLGFKRTGGKLVTIDSYIEEKSEDCYIYDGKKQTFEDTMGYKSRRHLVNFFELNDNVKLEVGWSPDDVESILKKNNHTSLDFVFLDGGHFEGQILKDFNAFIPFLEEKNIIILHDYFDDSYTQKVMDFLISKFGKLPEVIFERPYGDNLAILKNY